MLLYRCLTTAQCGMRKVKKFEAGRNDMFMAVHLPYCDKFVTAEKYGEQERCLREVVAVAVSLETEIFVLR